MARPSNSQEVSLFVCSWWWQWGDVLGRGCPFFHADRLLIFKSPPGGSQSFDELLMREPDLTINFPRVIMLFWQQFYEKP